jgi:hypothetical protein
MATMEKPIWQDNAGTGVPASYTAAADRTFIAAAFPYSGVIGVNDLKCSQRALGADSSVDVSIGRAIIYATGSTDKAYFTNVSGTIANVALPAAPVSNSQLHRVWLQINDSTVSGAVDSAAFIVTSGTVSASPSTPAAPSGGPSLLLAQVSRSVGVATVLNAVITDLRVLLKPAIARVSNPDNNVTPIVATTISNGESVAGVSFVAPPSGTVLLMCNASWNIASGTGSQVNLGPCIRNGATAGSGSVFYTPDYDPGTKLTSSVAGTNHAGVADIVTGLTPGAFYNATVVCWVQSAGVPMNYFGRQLSVIPMP